ncbi:MAG: MotA/TolQ/ExbB proton channel family protein [Elusimicrobiota bacterium]
MNLTFLNTLALTGGEWVIYLLLICSVVAGAVILERAIVLWREGGHLTRLREALAGDPGGDLEAMGKVVRAHGGAAGRVLQAGFARVRQGAESVADHLVAATLIEKVGLERRLLILGTLGNNAPFIGLFGTVLGVIKAFHDLARKGSNPEAVMEGLSEALIATAVGLFVAIPCVIAFNYFQGKVKELLAGTESLGRMLQARAREAQGGGK